MLTLINPSQRPEPFDHAEWVFEAKFDGFRASPWPADLAQRQSDEALGAVLDLLPKGYVFDGELVVLDDAGRPLSRSCYSAAARPTYVAFDLLIADGMDLRPLPLRITIRHHDTAPACTDIDRAGDDLRTFELGRHSGDQGQGVCQCAEGASYLACSRHVVYFAPVLPPLDLTHQ